MTALASDPPIRRRAAALPPEERRSMIIEATIPLLLEHGEMVTTRQIADAAGIAEGTVFRAFADKDELLAAVLEAMLDPEPLEQAIGELDVDLPMEELVTAAVEVAQRRIVDIWRLVSAIGPRYHDRSKRELRDSPALTRLLTPYADALSVPPRTAARTLRALTLAMSHPLMVERPAPPKEITHVFLYGVTKRDR